MQRLRKIAPHDVPRLSNHTRVARRRMLKLQRMTPAERERHQSLHLQATARSASTQNQTLSAILFLYREVLKVEAFSFDLTVRARRPERLPVVPTKQEVRAILDLTERPGSWRTCFTCFTVRGCVCWNA